jgi:hypothetical protein
VGNLTFFTLICLITSVFCITSSVYIVIASIGIDKSTFIGVCILACSLMLFGISVGYRTLKHMEEDN